MNRSCLSGCICCSGVLPPSLWQGTSLCTRKLGVFLVTVCLCVSLTVRSYVGQCCQLDRIQTHLGYRPLGAPLGVVLMPPSEMGRLSHCGIPVSGCSTASCFKFLLLHFPVGMDCTLNLELIEMLYLLNHFCQGILLQYLETNLREAKMVQSQICDYRRHHEDTSVGLTISRLSHHVCCRQRCLLE